MTRLVAEDLRFAYGDAVVLQGVDLRLEPGSMTLLAGPNGAGKSTLMGLLAGIARPDSGVVRVGDDALGPLPSMQRARTITLIPQDSDTSFEFTGREHPIPTRRKWGMSYAVRG